MAGDPTAMSESSATEIALAASPFLSEGFLTSVYCASSTSCVLGGRDENSEPLSILSTSPAAPVSSVTYVSVTFSSAGGSGALPSGLSQLSGSTLSLPSGASLAKAGYVFGGWSDGTSVFQPGDIYRLGASSVTFSAIWTPIASPVVKHVPKPVAPTSAVVYFAFNSFVLTPAAMFTLENFAAVIKRSDVHDVFVTASTDNRASESYNIPLSNERARSAGTYLETQLSLLGDSTVSIHLRGTGISTTQPTPALNRRAIISIN